MKPPSYAADRPKVPEVLPLVKAMYSGKARCTLNVGRVGGHLHCVLDDDNLADYFVLESLREARADGCVTCAELAEKMVQMTPTQRRKLGDLKWR